MKDVAESPKSRSQRRLKENRNNKKTNTTKKEFTEIRTGYTLDPSHWILFSYISFRKAKPLRKTKTKIHKRLSQKHSKTIEKTKN